MGAKRIVSAPYWMVEDLKWKGITFPVDIPFLTIV